MNTTVLAYSLNKHIFSSCDVHVISYHVIEDQSYGVFHEPVFSFPSVERKS